MTAAAAQGEAGGGAPDDLYSLRQLASLLKVDRNGLAGKVQALESFPGPRGSRLYSLEAVEEALAAESDPELAEARRRKLRAEAGLAELKLGRESGELVSQREAFGHAFKLFRAMHLRLGVRMPGEISAQLYRAQSEAQVADVLRREVGRAFSELKANQEAFITRAEEAAQDA